MVLNETICLGMLAELLRAQPPKGEGRLFSRQKFCEETDNCPQSIASLGPNMFFWKLRAISALR